MTINGDGARMLSIERGAGRIEGCGVKCRGYRANVPSKKKKKLTPSISTSLSDLIPCSSAKTAAAVAVPREGLWCPGVVEYSSLCRGVAGVLESYWLRKPIWRIQLATGKVLGKICGLYGITNFGQLLQNFLRDQVAFEETN